MASITSIKDCFDAETNLSNTYITNLAQIISDITAEKNRLLKNDIYYGKSTFYCGEYVPIKSKMTNIDTLLTTILTDATTANREIHRLFWRQRILDLDDYRIYCEEQMSKYHTGYLSYNAKKKIQLQNFQNMNVFSSDEQKTNPTITQTDKDSYNNYINWQKERNQANLLKEDAREKMIPYINV